MRATKVVVPVAKNRDLGMMPSLAISCFTVQGCQSSPIASGFGEAAIPREAVNVMTTRLPKMQKATSTAIAFCADPSPNMFRKKSVAISRFDPSC